MLDGKVMVLETGTVEEVNGVKGYHRTITLYVEDPELWNQLKDPGVEIVLGVKEVVKITNEKRGDVFEAIKNYTILKTGDVKPRSSEIKEWKEYFYAKMIAKYKLESFSLSSCTIEQGQEIIDMINAEIEGPF